MERKKPTNFEQKLTLFFPPTLEELGRSQFFYPEVNMAKHIMDFPFIFHLTNKASVQKRSKDNTGQICWSTVLINSLMYIENRFLRRLKDEFHNVKVLPNETVLGQTDINQLTPLLYIAQLPKIIRNEYQNIYDLQKGIDPGELRTRGSLCDEKLMNIESSREMEQLIHFLNRYASTEKNRLFSDRNYPFYIKNWELVERGVKCLTRK